MDHQEVVKFVRGTEASILSSTPIKGYIFFALDTQKIYYGSGTQFILMGRNSGSGEGVAAFTPDWNENTPYSPNYILNRPFYTTHNFDTLNFSRNDFNRLNDGIIIMELPGHVRLYENPVIIPNTQIYTTNTYPSYTADGTMPQVLTWITNLISPQNYPRPNNLKILDTNYAYQILLDNNVIYEGVPLDVSNSGITYYTSESTPIRNSSCKRILGDGKRIQLCMNQSKFNHQLYSGATWYDETIVTYSLYLSLDLCSSEHVFTIKESTSDLVVQIPLKYVPTTNTITSNNLQPITSNAVYILGNELTSRLNSIQDQIITEYTPSANSQNLVTSGGIFHALSLKQDKLIFDNTPTLNSQNPVTSDGIYKLIYNLLEKVSNLQQRVADLEQSVYGEYASNLQMEVRDNTLYMSGQDVQVIDDTLIINSPNIEVQEEAVIHGI